MTHRAITADYLSSFERSGLRAADVLDAVRHSTVDTSFGGRSLSRPVFLGHGEITQLTEDLDRLRTLLTDLPARMFGGDMAAFARAVGGAETQVKVSVRGQGDTPPQMCRADLLLEETGFRLMEINWGSALGGLDSGGLNRAMLDHPFVGDFVTRRRLTYVDPMVELVETLFTECKVPSGTRPAVALTDWPQSFPSLEARLHRSAADLAAFGMDAYPCHLGQLRYSDGRVWLGEAPIDVVYRLFMTEDLLDESGPALIEPVLQAADRRDVAIFTSMDSELYGSKGALALLTDESMRVLYEPDELATLDRILPWTRIVRSGPVTVDGAGVDLLDYALKEQHELILKPSMLHGGMGVVPGWTVDAEEWRQRIEAAMDQPHVLQRRIRAVPEIFPTDTGTESWILTWGIFMGSRGYAGMYLRGSTSADVTNNMSTGGTGTCCFHEAGPL